MPTPVPILMGNVYCTGTETLLAKCTIFSQLGLQNENQTLTCDSFDHIGVRCDDYQPTGCSEGSVRLTERATPGSGKLQLCLNNTWSEFCAIGMDSRATSAVCRQLGYVAGYSQYSSTANSHPQAYLVLNCSGTDSNLLQLFRIVCCVHTFLCPSVYTLQSDQSFHLGCIAKGTGALSVIGYYNQSGFQTPVGVMDTVDLLNGIQRADQVVYGCIVTNKVETVSANVTLRIASASGDQSDAFWRGSIPAIFRITHVLGSLTSAQFLSTLAQLFADGASVFPGLWTAKCYNVSKQQIDIDRNLDRIECRISCFSSNLTDQVYPPFSVAVDAVGVAQAYVSAQLGGLGGPSQLSITVISRYQFCDSSVTTSPQGNYSWPEASGISVVNLPCAFGPNSNTVSRVCSLNGVWQAPDLTRCSTAVSDLFRKLGSIILDGQNIADVSQSLVDGVTMAGVAEQSLQNIAFVGDILNQKAGLIQNMSNSSFLAIAKQVTRNAVAILDVVQGWPRETIALQGNGIVQSLERMLTGIAQNSIFTNFMTSGKTIAVDAEKVDLNDAIVNGQHFTASNGSAGINVNTRSSSSSVATKPRLCVPARLPLHFVGPRVTPSPQAPPPPLGYSSLCTSTAAFFPLRRVSNSVINSPVVGASVINLNLTDTDNTSFTNPRCVFWDYTAAGGQGNWSEGGGQDKFWVGVEKWVRWEGEVGGAEWQSGWGWSGKVGGVGVEKWVGWSGEVGRVGMESGWVGVEKWMGLEWRSGWVGVEKWVGLEWRRETFVLVLCGRQSSVSLTLLDNSSMALVREVSSITLALVEEWTDHGWPWSWFAGGHEIGEDSVLCNPWAELLEALHGNSNLIPNFKHYFTGLMLLAGSSKNEGHLSLVSAVASWLKLCASFAGSKPANVEEKQDPLVPATYLLQYLAHLTTAVQFSTNRASSSHPPSSQELESEDDAEGMLMGEEFQGDEREGDESLNNKLCTFTTTQRSFMNQHWYHCHTCKLVDGSGMCSICAKVCHKGHDVMYSKFGSFFCDCGAKEDKSCKCDLCSFCLGDCCCQSLVKRTGKAEDDKLPAAADVREKVLFDSKKKRRKRRHRKLAAEKGGDASKCRRKGLQEKRTTKLFPITHCYEDGPSDLRSYLDSCAVVDSALQLVGHIVPAITSQAASVVGSGPSKAQQALMDLHTSAKEIELDGLACDIVGCSLVATLGSQEGPFENVRLNLNGDQGQILKQLVTSNAIRRVAMCSLSSIKGKKQHITVNHDKGKVREGKVGEGGQADVPSTVPNPVRLEPEKADTNYKQRTCFSCPFPKKLFIVVVVVVVFFFLRKKRSKQRAEYLQKREDILSQENKAKARARYKADPEKKKASADLEKKKASVRDTYKADAEKKASVRDTYKADPDKKASVRDTYKADPEKKKASVRDTYNANAVSKRAAKRQRYQEGVEENRAAKKAAISRGRPGEPCC
eukprot:Em0019g139a